MPRYSALAPAVVLAFGFDPIHRYETESDFRLVGNAIPNGNDLPATPLKP